jgi:hypothetical protein
MRTVRAACRIWQMQRVASHYGACRCSVRKYCTARMVGMTASVARTKTDMMEMGRTRCCPSWYPAITVRS